jgi:hypothetical protein
MTREEFDICSLLILRNIFTITELKMGIEYYTRMVFMALPTRNTRNKSVLITTITQMVCNIYSFEFAPIRDNTLTESNPLTESSNIIDRVIRRVLSSESSNIIDTVITRVLSMEFSITMEHSRRRNQFRRSQNIRRYPYAFSDIILPQIQVSITSDNCKDEECPICFEKLNNATYTRLTCRHEVCKECIIKCVNKNIRNCALCRTPITNLYTQNMVNLPPLTI